MIEHGTRSRYVSGCRHTFRECWGAFVEQAPEWWWDVLTDRPEPKRQEDEPTLF